MNQKKLITIVVTYCILSIAGGPLRAAEPFLVSTIGEAPLSTPSHDGYQDLIIKELFHRLGQEIKIITPPGKRALTQINDGEHDATYTRIKGLEKAFPNIVPIPEKILDVYFVGITTKSNIENKGWETLSDYRVAYIRGWVIFDKNVISKKPVEIVDKSYQLFKMLAADRVDIILYEKWQGLHIINDLKVKNVRVLLPPLKTMEMFMYVHKQHEGIVDKITNTLRTMKDDGTFKEIYNQKLAPLHL